MESQQKIITVCLLALTFMGLTASLIYTKSILIPLTISFFLYEATIPVINFLCMKAKFPKYLSVFLTLVSFILFVLVIVIFISNSLESFIKGADLYREKIIISIKNVTEILNKEGIIFDNKAILDQVRNLPVFSFAKKLTGGVFTFVGDSVLVLIFIVFMLAGETKVSKRRSLAREVHYKISRYLVTKLSVSLATGILVGVTLAIFEVELAFLIGILTFLLNFIPSIGSIIAMIIPLPILFLQYGMSWQTPVVFIICGLIQFIIGNIIEPKFMGESMDLHPITILVALLFWGLVWGVPGMFLSVPMTAVLKILLERIEETRPIALVLSGKWTMTD